MVGFFRSLFNKLNLSSDFITSKGAKCTVLAVRKRKVNNTVYINTELRNTFGMRRTAKLTGFTAKVQETLTYYWFAQHSHYLHLAKRQAYLLVLLRGYSFFYFLGASSRTADACLLFGDSIEREAQMSCGGLLETLALWRLLLCIVVFLGVGGVFYESGEVKYGCGLF